MEKNLIPLLHPEPRHLHKGLGREKDNRTAFTDAMGFEKLRQVKDLSRPHPWPITAVTVP